MPYIGTQPLTGQFKKLDAITVVNGQAAYTLNYNSAAYKPATANALLVSVNGVIQAAGDAYTINGSTITFTENLVTGDVIDFIIALGDTGSAVTPVDGSVTTAKIATDAVTSDKLAHDLTIQTSLSVPTIKDSSGSNTAMTIDSTGRILTPARPAFSVSLDASSATGVQNVVQFDLVNTNVGSHYDTSNHRFVAPIAGLYHFSFSSLGCGDVNGGALAANTPVASQIQRSTDSGSNYSGFAAGYGYFVSTNSYPNIGCSAVIELTAGDYVQVNIVAGFAFSDSSGNYDARFSGFLVG